MTTGAVDSASVPPHGRRVAVLLHEPQIGGATRSVLRVLPHLERHGWSFCFWVAGEGAAAQELRERGYEVGSAERLLRFSLASLREPPGTARRLRSLPAYWRSFRAWLAAQAPDLVHANTVLALPEVLARPAGGPPVVLHAHEVLPDGFKGAIAARLARRADVVVAVSEAVAAAMRRRGAETIVVHPGVELPVEVRRGPRSGPLVVGTIGTVCRRKGSDVFLDAARLVAERDNGFQFRLVGEPVVGGERPWAERLLDQARRQGVDHRVVSDPYAELAEWDIFVLPSRMDPCPLAVLEAMATGLPVVGSRTGGIPEEVGDDAGLLVEVEDAEGVAAAVRRLAQAPELREALGSAGRRRVERLFSLERQAGQLDGAYRAALGAPGSTGEAGGL